MASRKSYHSHIAQPLSGRHWFYRATLLMLVTFGIALIVMSKAGNPAIGKLRTSINDAVMPVLAVAASPFDVVHDAGVWMKEMVSLRAENIALKNQNLQLLQWQATAKDLEEENRSLRELLNAVPSRKRSYITARVVSDLGGPYVHSALLNGGSEQGIKKDQAVINESGLAGRVVDVGKTSARVLLLTDINSRVPVMAEKAHEKAILAGSNNDTLNLTYLTANSAIQEGDRLVTSGDGGVFPPGIPVGIVTSIEKGAVSVQPFVDPIKIEYVSILDYSL
jgi:rod shape-determining protein MreC